MTKLKSVLQINTLGATQSTGRTTRELHNYLLQHNIDSYIACPRKEDCDDAFIFSSLKWVHLDVLLSIITGHEGKFSTIQTYKLIRFIKNVNPSIVHLRVLHVNCLNFKLLFSYLAKNDIPVVITLHDFWYLTGQCCYFTIVGCEKWKTGCGKCPSLMFGRHKPFFDRTPKMWNEKKKYISKVPRLAVIGVSDWVSNIAKESYLSKATIIKRIYNWIDLDVFCKKNTEIIRRNLNLNNKKVILGVSSIWTENDRKGLNTYIELAYNMPDEYIILLVGQFNYKGKIPKNIICYGKTDNVDELAQLYSLADVYLNLSKEETFGKVSAEAISCGTPLIAVDSSANKEIIPNGGGKLLKDSSIKEILDALEEIFSK